MLHDTHVICHFVAKKMGNKEEVDVVVTLVIDSNCSQVSIAQSVEPRTGFPQVAGSSPA